VSDVTVIVRSDDIRHKLLATQRALSTWKPAFSTFARRWYAIEREWFDTAAYGSWPALKESTVAEKQSKGYRQPDRILYASGDLRRSATSPNGRWSGHVYMDHVATFEIRWAPAVYHQIGAGNLPERKIFDAGPRAMDALKMSVRDHVQKVLSR
jgi:hypothetical protein